VLRSMYAGVSGLRSHQAFMDVVGNNIANVNTTGYKSSTVLFQDLLSQTLRGASGPSNGLAGGTNPAQVGLGVRLADISTNLAQGATQLTGRALDFAIQGDGYFIIDAAGTRAYTRAGSFNVDSHGQLVTPDGALVLGWQADQNGVINANATVGALRIPVGQTIAPITTSKVTVGGNLPADAAVGTTINSTITVYNSLGTQVPLRVEFTKVANGSGSVDWEVRTYSDTTQVSGPTALSFDLNGVLTTGSLTVPASGLDGIAGTAGTWGGSGITLDFGTATDPDRLTGAAVQNSVAALRQDGSPIGALVGFSVGADGTISGVFSSGRTQALGQIAMANFANPAGLEKAGGSLLRATINSGEPMIGTPGSAGRGTLAGGSLEMSNVDLAQEFTNLISAQRGFQANSRIITASDELLQDLVNMKR
jgi:flagellar hook protein FlgE